ncbi:hypothetical protein LTR53_019925, partial [Teratosphaeriaceae sp. CCFEE 6253]
MANGAAESDLDSEAALAARELDLALAALDSGLELRSATLRLLLDRCTAFPRAALTAAMRGGMGQEELVFFVKILRIELLQGGWCRP